MSSNSGAARIAAVVGPMLAAVSAEQRPLLIALAERMAGERYRLWAQEYSDDETRNALMKCGDREDEIASLVEALYPDAAETQAKLRSEHPGLQDLNESLFGGMPLLDQFAMQAEGERAGAATWRALAKDASPEANRTFLECAGLEERSAEVLEALLGQDR